MAAIFLTFLQISLSVSIVTAALLLLTPLMNRRYAAKWKYWIWIFLALRLIVPFGGNAAEAVEGLLHQEEGQDLPSSGTGDADALPWQEMLPGRVIVEIPEQMTTPIEIQAKREHIRITPLDAAAFLWLCGCVGILSIHIVSYMRYKGQILRRGSIITDPCILRQVSELQRELRIKSAVYAVEYPEAASPMMIGFLNPLLVLPEESYESEELFFILKHELVHLKRRDVYMKLLFVTASALHWFNPLVWMMRREAAVDMELSCDERVTKDTDYAVRRAYTETLLSMLHKRCVRRTALSTQFYGGKQIMKKRFRNILLRTGKKNGAAILVCAVLLTVSLGTLVGCSAVKTSARETEEGSGQMQNDEDQESSQSVDNQEPGMPGTGEAESGLREEDQPAAELPQNGQIYGYISSFGDGRAVIDRQIWATPDSEEWNPEYDDAAGFEVVDAEGEDIAYPLGEDCVYSVLENHTGPAVELDAEGFADYLREMEYPVLWVMELEDGQIKNVTEQYRP